MFGVSDGKSVSNNPIAPVAEATLITGPADGVTGRPGTMADKCVIGGGVGEFDEDAGESDVIEEDDPAGEPPLV